MQKGWDGEASSKGEDEEVGWDIDTDSACYASEENSITGNASPLRRQMSLLGM